MSFSIFRALPIDGVCAVTEALGVDDAFEVNRGISRAASWSEDAHVKMRSYNKRDIGLADCLVSIGGPPVVSKRLGFALSERTPDIELLPVKVLNPKDKVASEDHFVLNPLRIVDCIDEAASVVDRNALNPAFISSVEQLVLREAAVPPDVYLFRLGSWPSVLIIREAFAAELQAAGFTGLHFLDPLDFTG
jgi:hypothetical protein